jgi:glutamyl-Q tRNA(Asp) synthetase
MATPRLDRSPGRFAPSPTGPLHAGSMVAALASWLDARARGAGWLVRIEDVDVPRCIPGMDRVILGQLAQAGMTPDAPVVHQSRRGVAYRLALDQLRTGGWAYDCACSRADIERALAAMGHQRQRHQQPVYPGTCRGGLQGRPARATRMRVQRGDSPTVIDWADRRLGAQTQDLAREVGDFVLQRADGLWAYQLAVVVDDAWQGIGHIVRGEDLADNTARQILLQRALGLPTPSCLHTPLVLAADGQKLSKQNGALPVDLGDPVRVLRDAAGVLRLPPIDAGNAAEWLARAVPAWASRWVA